MITPQMSEWLSANMLYFETLLLHGIMHDSSIRAKTLGLLDPKDMSGDATSLLVAALKMADDIHQQLPEKLPTPPSVAQLAPHIKAAAVKDYGEAEVGMAITLVLQLQDVIMLPNHVYIAPYFEAWFTTVRAQRAGRTAQRHKIVDAGSMVANLQGDIDSASRAFRSDDGKYSMDAMFDGEDDEAIARFSTGVAGLDTCLNGGFAMRETYLGFGGTGAGKSVLVAQLCLHSVLISRYTCLVTTELEAYQYISRIISAGLSIPYEKLVDCTTIRAMRAAISADAKQQYKIQQFDELIGKIRKFLHIQKIDSDDGLSGAMFMEREFNNFRDKFGVEPTLMLLDWLGDIADNKGGGVSSSDRARAWEISAAGICKWTSEKDNVSTFVFAQAVNDTEGKAILTLGDIGIGKGIGKKMVLVVGLTNRADIAALKLAASGKGEVPRDKFLREQFLCVCKARNGETFNVPVSREFRFQRVVERVR